MTGRKEKQHDDNIKFEKDLQLTACYYTLLLFFAVIALFKVPGANLKSIVTETYWLIGIVTFFALVYQIHLAYGMWKFRDKTKTNSCGKKILLFFYTGCFVSLIVLVAFITLKFLSGI